MAKTRSEKDLSIPVELGGIFDCLLKDVRVREPEFNVSHINHEPVVDMFSTSDSIVIEVELPGVRKEEIEINFMRNLLTIMALKYECFSARRINFVCMERSFGRFCKVIELNQPVDSAGIKAVYRDGILTITLPNVEDRRGVSKKIPIE